MSTQQASNSGVLRAAEILDLTIAQAHKAERKDLIQRLSDARRLLADFPVTVQVVGGAQQGKSSLMEVLIVPSATHNRPDNMTVDLPAGRLVLAESRAMATSGAGSLPPCSAVLFVSDAAAELTHTEIEHLRTVQDLCPTIIFVLTKIDVNAQWRQVFERDKALLHEAGIGVEAVAVSATSHTLGLRRGDEELIQLSGVAKVLDQLERIAADAERTSLRAVTNNVLFMLDELAGMLRFRRSRLVQPGRSAHARTAARAAEERLDEVRSSAGRWKKLLYDSFATISLNVDFDLRQRMQAVLAEVEHTIEHSNPAKNWDEFADWLRERLTVEAAANHELVVTSSRDVSLQVAKHVAPGEMLIVDPPPATIVTDLPTALTTDHALDSARIGLSATVNIALRAYLGFVMFFLLTSVAGLKLPMILALAPTALMGGLAVVKERNRQLEKRRNQVNTTVRSYVTDFSTRVAKDSRDLLRQLQQDLRDGYSARSEQTQRSLTETLNLSYRTLQELERSPELLTGIDTDLVMLDELRARATAIIPGELLAPSAAIC
jgi:hypothetical protein